MSGRRRAYPQPQYGTGGNVGSAAPPDPNQYQQVPGVQGAPGASYGVDQVGKQFQNLNVGGQPAIAPYQYNQGAAVAGAPVADPYNQVPAGQYGAPAGQYGAPAGQYGAPAGQYGGQTQQQQAPQQGYYGAPQNAAVGLAPALPLNQLYTTDLSKELPPPISDLLLPPPPIVLPSGTTLVPNSETSNAAPEFFRSTLNVIPNNNSLLKKSKLPLALIVKPYLALTVSGEDVQVTSDTYISRCRRCRGYINPFVTLAENGRRWRCNFCNLLNDIPSAFEYDDINGTVKNKFDRVELNHAVVEFIAPKEYMARAPQPIVYTFIIDVSVHAVQNGLTGTITRTILESLDRIPNTNKTARVAFVGVDSNLHYFKFNEGLDGIDIMIVSDIDEPFLPSPSGLLVNLEENRPAIEKLLLDFPSYFDDTANQSFALGPALKAGHKMINNIGGKLICFGATLPNIGEGKLAVREDVSGAGKPKDAKALLAAADSFYKAFAVTCNSSQVTVDLFLTSSTYQDVATLSNLPRYTAGQTHFYPAWSSARVEDVTKLSKEVSDHLSQDIALEAVLRVRGSTGFRMSSFYGNFFNRLSDLCAFPTFPRDQSYTIEVSIEENINKPVVYFQAAILHSTSFGERRIRVLNLAIPTSSQLADVYASADQLAITNYFTHRAIEKVLATSLSDTRDYVTKLVLDILNVYKKELVAGNVSGASPLQLSTNLRMLPLLLFSLNKNLAFRSGVPSDHRAAALNNLGSFPIPQLIKTLYPTIYSLHNMGDDCGLPEKVLQFNEETGEEEEITTTNILLPEPINDAYTTFENYGLFLIDTSSELFLWVSGNVVPGLVNDLFGIEDLYALPVGKTELPEFSLEESEFNYRVRQIIGKIREQKDSIVWKSLYVVLGQSSAEPIEISQQPGLVGLRLWAKSCCVEDKVNTEITYREFLTSLKTKMAT